MQKSKFVNKKCVQWSKGIHGCDFFSAYISLCRLQDLCIMPGVWLKSHTWPDVCRSCWISSRSLWSSSWAASRCCSITSRSVLFGKYPKCQRVIELIMFLDNEMRTISCKKCIQASSTDVVNCHYYKMHSLEQCQRIVINVWRKHQSLNQN